MDLPPSGWYPDPYGVPGLLRWWDGSAWTQHTHAESAPAREAMDSAQSPTTVERMTPQPTTVQPAVTDGEPVAVTAAQPAIAQPTTAQPTTVQPTTVQPAVTDGEPVAVTAAQPAIAQPTTVQPTTVQPVPQEDDASGTRVLFLDNATWVSPGVAADPVEDGRFGYHHDAKRRRRIWLMSGLVGGVAVALAVIALVVDNMGQSPASSTAAQLPTTPAAAGSPAAAMPTTSPSASATATESGSTVTDGTSGLSYAQLSTPWQPGCPSDLSGQAFTWTAGESAVAGQISNGQTWYGAACSGPLPQQYGYNGVADLANVANSLVGTFDGTYYSALPHSRNDIASQPVSVSGHPGWEIKFLMTYTSPQGLAWTNELGAVVVADEGTGVAPAVFYVSVPGNLNENNVNTLVSSLQLTVPAQPGGGSPVAGSPVAGSPAPAN
jgi:hypothetical protein